MRASLISMVGDDRAETANLYIGGWEPTHDGEHGNPVGHTGVLDIRGGELSRARGGPRCLTLPVRRARS